MADTWTPYGILLSSFFDGTTGMRLQAAGGVGKDALILGAFLSANEWANMIGLYELTFAKLARKLPILKGKPVLMRAFALLDQERFAHYDEETEFVWVREMARVRLNLINGQVISNANRLKGAQACYQRAPLNPFLGPFYDRYHVEMALKHRREGPSKPLRSDSEARLKPLRSDSEVSSTDQVPVHQVPVPVLSTQELRDQLSTSTDQLKEEQRPDGRGPHQVAQGGGGKTADPARSPAADGNYSVLLKLTHTVMDEEGVSDPTNPDLIEAVKRAAAAKRIIYLPDVLNRALRSAGTQRVRGGSASPAGPLAELVDRVKGALDNNTLGETAREMSKAARS